MISQKNLIHVHAVDQMLDFYELKLESAPEVLSVSRETYNALLAFINDGKREPYMQIQSYRNVKLEIKK